MNGHASFLVVIILHETALLEWDNICEGQLRAPRQRLAHEEKACRSCDVILRSIYKDWVRILTRNLKVHLNMKTFKKYLMVS